MEKLLKIKERLQTIYDINYLKNEYSERLDNEEARKGTIKYL